MPIYNYIITINDDGVAIHNLDHGKDIKTFKTPEAVSDFISKLQEASNEKFNSGNTADHSLSARIGEMFDVGNRNTEALHAYEKTINKIDDFFEYANDSKKDRTFIQEQLDILCNKLQVIYHITKQ